MFADALLDSQQLGHPRRGWATLTSFGLQAIAVACLLIVPLFYMQVLPHLQSTSTIIAPPVGPAPIQQTAPAVVAAGGPSIFTIAQNNGVRTSSVVPRGIDLGSDVEPPSFPLLAGDTTGRTGSGIPGVLGGTGVGVPPIMPRQSATANPPRISAMMEGSLMHRVEPIYPAIARSAHIQGTVIIAAVIGKDGGVEKLQVLSGHPLLVQAAINAVSQWRYRPYMLNNAPIEVDTQITVNFILAR